MEHYLLIGPNDLTAQLPADKDHQWHYAAPGTVSSLLADLNPKPKLSSKKPVTKEATNQLKKKKPVVEVEKPRVQNFVGAHFAACPTDADLQALFKYVDSYRVTCAPAVLKELKTPLQTDYFKAKVVRPLPLTEWDQIVKWLQTRLFEGQGGGKT